MKKIILRLKEKHIIRKNNKKIDKLLGKRKSHFARTVNNIFFISLRYVQYVLYIGFVAGLSSFLFSFKDKFISSVNHGTVLSFALTFYGFLISIFAVLLSRESERFLNKRFLKIVLDHSYLIHNSYSIIGIPTVFVFANLLKYFTDEELSIAFSFVVIVSSTVSIIFMMISIVRSKSKMLLSYFLPLHKTHLFDSIVISKGKKIKQIDKGSVNDELLTLIIKKNKYIKGYDKMLDEVCAFFKKDILIADADIILTNKLINKFRINQYDFDSMAYLSKLSKSILDISKQLIKREEFNKSFVILDNYFNRINEIIESKDMKKLYADMRCYPLTKAEVSLSVRLIEQIKGQNLLCASLLTTISCGLEIIKAYPKTHLKKDEKIKEKKIESLQEIVFDKIKKLIDISHSNISYLDDCIHNA